MVGAVADGVDGATNVATKIGGEIATHVAEGSVKAVSPIIETTAKADGIVAPTVENTVRVVEGAQESTFTDQAAIDGATKHVEELRQAESPKPEPAKAEDKTPEGSAAKIAKEQMEKLVEELRSNPEFQAKISARKQALKTGENIDFHKIELEEATKLAQEIILDDSKQAQGTEKTNLTDEQQSIIRDFFRNDSSGAREFTREASKLAGAKAVESKLREQNSSAEQIDEATETRRAYEAEYNAMIKDHIKNTYQNFDPNHLENYPLIILLSNAPNNPEVLKLMQNESKKSLAKTLLDIILVIFGSLVKETVGGLVPPLKQ